MILYHHLLNQKLFTKRNIFLGFSVVLLLQLCFSLALFHFDMTGLSIFRTCGIFLPDNNSTKSVVPIIAFQTQSYLTLLSYSLSIVFGIQIVRHIRHLSANVTDGFQVGVK